MTASPHDIKLGGKGYLVVPGGYLMSESPKSYPAKGGASSQEFAHPDNWTYWGQSDWSGEGEELKDWITDGPFHQSYGLDLSTPGECKVARKFTQVQSDATNSGGYVAFTVGTTRACFLGKTTETLWHSTNGTSWTSQANTPATGVRARSWGELKGTYYISTDNGKLYSTTDGLTYTDRSTGGPTTEAWILDSYKSKIWVGYANKLYTYDGTTWAEQFAGFIDGTPVAGAVGAGGLYFITAGPNARLYQTDGNALYQLATIKSDFLPKSVVFLETIYVFGHMTDDASTKGHVWRLTQSGLMPIFEYGDGAADYGIRSAILDGRTIIWGANQRTGIGIFDPSADIYEDLQLGFYTSSVITSLAGVVHGIVQFGGRVIVGIQSQGLYRQDTPGTFRILSSRFDGNSKNVNKMWGFSELRHSALAANQTITLKSTKDGTTFTTWGTSDTDTDTSKIVSAPASYKSPFLQYELTGDAAGSDLSLFDIALAYIEASDNPKREWDLLLGLEGSSDRPQKMRDGTDNDRTAVQMYADLNALWNTVTTYEDLDGTVYNVVVKVPRAKVEDFIKDVDTANALQEIALYYRVHLTQL